MLHRLPIQILADIPRHGLVLRVRCDRCGQSRPVEITEDLAARPFGRQRYRCTTLLADRMRCPGYGSPIVSEPERRRIDATLDTKLFFLFCTRCVPSWEISAVDAHKPPWNEIASWTPGDRYRCPACGGRVDWHVHERPWRPARNGVGGSSAALPATSGF